MTDASDALQQTPLHDLHLELGARMVPFAGYSMPVQYPAGVKQEHLHTRARAGLFDVSHMGQLFLRGPGVESALERLVPADILGLPRGRQRYALFTNEEGGVMDDLMVSQFGDCLYLLVNAACKAADIAHLRGNLGPGIDLEPLEDRALIALQGPAAGAVMARFAPESAALVFMDSQPMEVAHVPCLVSRSGYTGEDGFEISVPAARAEQLVRELLAEDEVAPAGLGARDSLRLEAGLCLYGHDLDAATTPVESSLQWAISKARRADGERPGGFPGAGIILQQLAEKGGRRRRVGLVGEGRAPVREGAPLFDADDRPVGRVSSGTFGPSAGKPVAMAYVEPGLGEPGTRLFAEVRGRKLPMLVSPMPFVPQRYHRG